MSKSLYSGVNKVYFRSYLLLNIVASSAYIFALLGSMHIKALSKMLMKSTLHSSLREPIFSTPKIQDGLKAPLSDLADAVTVVEESRRVQGMNLKNKFFSISL